MQHSSNARPLWTITSSKVVRDGNDLARAIVNEVGTRFAQHVPVKNWAMLEDAVGRCKQVKAPVYSAPPDDGDVDSVGKAYWDTRPNGNIPSGLCLFTLRGEIEPIECRGDMPCAWRVTLYAERKSDGSKLARLVIEEAMHYSVTAESIRDEHSKARPQAKPVKK